MAQPVAGEDHQLQLLALMGFPHVHVGDLVRALPEVIRVVSRVDVVQLRAEVALVHVSHRLPDPCRHVDAVGHGEDLLVAQTLPGVVGRDAVEFADRVRGVGQTKRECGHVQLATVPVDAAGQFQDSVDRHPAGALAAVAVVQRPGNAPHQIGVEALVAGGHRCMDREDAVGADSLQGIFQSHSLRDEGAGPFHEQEGGVAFVEVPDCRRDAKGLEGPDAAGPEHQLLVQAHFAAADIQDVRHRPVRLGIFRNVRVQQEDRDASYLDEPNRGVEVALG